MLVDITIPQDEDPILNIVGNGQSSIPKKHRDDAPGLYVIPHFNMDVFIEGLKFEEQYPESEMFSPYGVCDSIDQFMEDVGKCLREDERKFVVSFTHVEKSPEDGGWRWHKWGPYIGRGKPEYEYLRDEKGFESGVWVYHIYDVTRVQNEG